MFLVGLTGGIATGKSTVSLDFQSLGCPCVDADLIARQVVEPGAPAYKSIKEHFGHGVFAKNGQLNREKLGHIIFNDSKKRKILNSIMHPAIKKRMLWEVVHYFSEGHQFIILDVPLLFETKQMLPFVSYTIVVKCDEEKQLKRLKERNNLSEEDALSRMRSQMPLNEKCNLATYVIDNNGDISETKQQVIEIHKKLQCSKRHWILRTGLLTVLFSIVGVLWFSLSKRLQ